MEVHIDNKLYTVNPDEYSRLHHKEYNNLRLHNDLGLHERIIGLIRKCKEVFYVSEPDVISDKTAFGGFIPLQLSSQFSNIWLLHTSHDHADNIATNLARHGVDNIHCFDERFTTNNNLIIYSEQMKHLPLVQERNKIIVTKQKASECRAHVFALSNTDYYVHVDAFLLDSFLNTFRYYINADFTTDGQPVLSYDNLMNLCIMVKNAGPQFEQMLQDNLPAIDRWTILDTGSTDETLDIIHRVLVGKREGHLYQEPFINFRESRNRLLDLAGSECKYNLMLDDTYVIRGDLRDFFTEVRSDQYANSFTLFIQSDDTKYGSNRVTRSDSGLRYIHKIHEVITDKNNINVVIPEHKCCIEDKRFEYMEQRTMERKQLDLKLLYEEMEEDPNDPRTYYYLAQTYNLLQDYEQAFNFFLKRATFTNSGFIQERVDALFEAARLANFQLGKPWEECLALYEQCYKVDESRPEPLYFIGIHYYLEGSYRKAFSYFKKGFEIGFPSHCQYSLKPTLSFHFLPKFLTRICYDLEEYSVGEAAARLFLENNDRLAADYDEIVSWHNIFVKLNQYNGEKRVKKVALYSKPLFVFVADGGFHPWSGSNMVTTGVGGSETYIIEMARYIQRSGKFQTIVFCNTPNSSEEVYENTIYKPLSGYYEFINTTYVNTCIVSRFSEYLPLTFRGFSENVYLVVHDLTPSGLVIPMDKKLKNVFCLTEWHVDYFTQCFSALKPITVPLYYGIDARFKDNSNNVQKVPFKFIYSSFPNRGLLQLLQMWPRIIQRQPLCILHIYSDVDNKWSNQVEPEKMQQIRDLLLALSDPRYGIHCYGWVKKEELAQAWLTSDIWFYPCTFMETFCLTALEAASSKTFVVTNELAALQNTVGDRGCIIPGDPVGAEWQEEALQQLFKYLDKDDIIALKEKQDKITRNYEWALNLSWENQAQKLLDLYIIPNTEIEYKGMYNWTNDVPQGEKQVFLDVLQRFNQTHRQATAVEVLEIGTYTGVSLLEIIKTIPNAQGTGVDLWSSYNENNLLENMDALGVEESFHKNVRSAGLTHRVKGLKCDSTEALLHFYGDHRYFDFIYVDGSHMLLDCYSDLVLAWNILHRNGILAIDDYTYKASSLLESPFEAVNHFLKRYEGRYNLLYKGYRVFLEKTV